jgi:lactam utilization protein B
MEPMIAIFTPLRCDFAALIRAVVVCKLNNVRPHDEQATQSVLKIRDPAASIDHLHDALDFAAEIGVSQRVNDIDAITLPLKGRVLCANGDSFLALEIRKKIRAL